MLRRNLPPGGWFPALQDLYWDTTESNVPHADMLFSPSLKKIEIHAALKWSRLGVPPGILPRLASTISALPTSSLERIEIGGGDRTIPWVYLKDSMSSIVLRCGASFTEYDSPVPLSDAAANHLIQLPHLHTLCIHGPPPSYSTASLPLVFPPLKELTLKDGAARGWISLLARLEDHASITQAATPLSNVRESLKSLRISGPSGIVIDASFVSPIQSFRNLVTLAIRVDCYDYEEDDEGQCAFKLNNDNVIELATALTQLESLFLGNVCSENTCSTTVTCLLPISVHCVKLENLEVHFNTTNIVNDFKDILEDPQFQHLRSLPRCPLDCLYLSRTPLALDEPGFETVAKGMIDIFPSLVGFEGEVTGPAWGELSDRIADIRKE